MSTPSPKDTLTVRACAPPSRYLTFSKVQCDSSTVNSQTHGNYSHQPPDQFQTLLKYLTKIQFILTKIIISSVDMVESEGPNKKIKLSEVGERDLSEKIVRQLDYYFSDVNVIKDKFLLQKFKEDDGWVKLSVLLTFVRLKELTKDEDRVVAALNEVDSEVLEVDATKKQVRRKHPLPDVEEFQKELDRRTLHISGFPTSLEFTELRSFFSLYGNVESVAMRRHFKTRFFKGCVHVVFKTEQEANKVMKENPLMCKDRELRKETMAEYRERKAKIAAEKLEKRKKKKNVGGGDPSGKPEKTEAAEVSVES